MRSITAIYEGGAAATRLIQLDGLKSMANGSVRSLNPGTLEATHQELRAGTAIGKKLSSVSLG
jgi:hypothetical protein